MSTATATAITSIISSSAAAIALVLHAYTIFRNGGKSQ